jgi:hypothetical protein
MGSFGLFVRVLRDGSVYTSLRNNFMRKNLETFYGLSKG